jgi:hypothetical protein
VTAERFDAVQNALEPMLTEMRLRDTASFEGAICWAAVGEFGGDPRRGAPPQSFTSLSEKTL